MKRTATITAITVGIVAVYFMFFHIQICVGSASARVSILSSIGVCPPFVNTKLEEIEGKFNEIVAVGDGSDAIENALTDMKITFSWDRFNQQYNGIIRDSVSNFHAITVKVYVDKQQKFTKIEANDSFTAL